MVLVWVRFFAKVSVAILVYFESIDIADEDVDEEEDEDTAQADDVAFLCEFRLVFGHLLLPDRPLNRK